VSQDPSNPEGEDEIPGGDMPDSVPFSTLRGIDIDARLRATRRLRDAFAKMYESGLRLGVNPHTTAISHLVSAVQDLEVQIADLREAFEERG
jgi:hypothetical protein